ncbi:MAG: hypothetical protein DMF63_13330 [Acidobacteria bacterium]|nr:MAG: hypothetical protein DMF63_13330 [Acidobacteriota bacterium]
MAAIQIDPKSKFARNLPVDLVIGDDAAQQTLLREYGAVFVARGGVTAPNRVVFEDQEEVAEFQSRLDIKASEVGGHVLELQSVAMDALRAAKAEASAAGLSISPRGSDSARRDYLGTVELWKSRVEPALVHWVGLGRMTAEHAAKIRSFAPYEQVSEVFALEKEGIYFAKDLSKSIIYSVAPPGASQHLSLLAFDVAEFDNADIRRILAEHFWYQTVVSDLPHFTFLGVPIEGLRDLGLRRVEHHEREFWIPDL